MSSRKRSQQTLKVFVSHTTTWWDVFLYFYNNWHSKERISLDDIDGPTCLCRDNYKSDYFYVHITGDSNVMRQLLNQGIQLRNKWRCKIEIFYDWPNDKINYIETTNKLYVDHLPETLKYDVEKEMLNDLFSRHGKCIIELYKTKGKEHYALIIYNNEDGNKQVHNIITMSTCGVLKLSNGHLIKITPCTNEFMPNVRGVFESTIKKKNIEQQNSYYKNQLAYLTKQLQFERMKQHEKQANTLMPLCAPIIVDTQQNKTQQKYPSLSLSPESSPMFSLSPPPPIIPRNWTQIVINEWIVNNQKQEEFKFSKIKRGKCSCSKNPTSFCRLNDCINYLSKYQCDSNNCNNIKCRNKTWAFSHQSLPKCKLVNVNINKQNGNEPIWRVKLNQKSLVAAGSLVGEIVGQITTYNSLKTSEQLNNAYKLTHNTLENNELYIDCSYKSNIFKWIRHSCNPNCIAQTWICENKPRLFLFAIKSIDNQRDISIDYATCKPLLKEDVVCNCHSFNCRGHIFLYGKNTKTQNNNNNSENMNEEEKHTEQEDDEGECIVENILTYRNGYVGGEKEFYVKWANCIQYTWQRLSTLYDYGVLIQNLIEWPLKIPCFVLPVILKTEGEMELYVHKIGLFLVKDQCLQSVIYYSNINHIVCIRSESQGIIIRLMKMQHFSLLHKESVYKDYFVMFTTRASEIIQNIPGNLNTIDHFYVNKETSKYIPMFCGCKQIHYFEYPRGIVIDYNLILYNDIYDANIDELESTLTLKYDAQPVKYSIQPQYMKDIKRMIYKVQNISNFRIQASTHNNWQMNSNKISNIKLNKLNSNEITSIVNLFDHCQIINEFESIQMFKEQVSKNGKCWQQTINQIVYITNNNDSYPILFSIKESSSSSASSINLRCLDFSLYNSECKQAINIIENYLILKYPNSNVVIDTITVPRSIRNISLFVMYCILNQMKINSNQVIKQYHEELVLNIVAKKQLVNNNNTNNNNNDCDYIEEYIMNEKEWQRVDKLDICDRIVDIAHCQTFADLPNVGLSYICKMNGLNKQQYIMKRVFTTQNEALAESQLPKQILYGCFSDKLNIPTVIVKFKTSMKQQDIYQITYKYVLNESKYDRLSIMAKYNAYLYNSDCIQHTLQQYNEYTANTFIVWHFQIVTDYYHNNHFVGLKIITNNENASIVKSDFMVTMLIKPSINSQNQQQLSIQCECFTMKNKWKCYSFKIQQKIIQISVVLNREITQLIHYLNEARLEHSFNLPLSIVKTRNSFDYHLTCFKIIINKNDECNICKRNYYFNQNNVPYQYAAYRDKTNKIYTDFYNDYYDCKRQAHLQHSCSKCHQCHFCSKCRQCLQLPLNHCCTDCICNKCDPNSKYTAILDSYSNTKELDSLKNMKIQAKQQTLIYKNQIYLRFGVCTYEYVFNRNELNELELLCQQLSQSKYRNQTLQISKSIIMTKKLWFGARYNSGSGNSNNKGIINDVDPIPKQLIIQCINKLENYGIIPRNFINSVAIDLYETGFIDIDQHIESIYRFARPFWIIALFDETKLTFETKVAQQNASCFIPLKRGMICQINEQSIAADYMRHSMQNLDVSGKNGVIVLRHIHNHLLLNA